MKKRLLAHFFAIAFFLLCISGNAQISYKIGFDTNTLSVIRSRAADTTIMVFFKTTLGNLRSSTEYKVVISVNTQQPDLPPYSFTFAPRSFSELSENDNLLNTTKIILSKDTTTRQKEITLTIQVMKGNAVEPDSNNKAQFKSIKIVVMPPAVATSAPVQSSYTLNFEKVDPKQRDKSDNIYPIYLNASGLGDRKNDSSYKVSVSVDRDSTDLSPMAYSLDFPDKYFYQLNTTDSSKNVGYLRINKDTAEDRQRQLILKMDVHKGSALDNNNKGLNKTVRILVRGITTNDTLRAYNYLAYVGTNFDLVDGPKAKNLFFATNVFLPPYRGKGLGMYLSLYGNRTMTATDTVGNIERTVKVTNLGDTAYREFTDRYNLARTQVSDNLGAYISPVIRLGSASSLQNQTQLYYTPSLEFVWRRTTISSVYSSSNHVDSLDEKGRFKGVIDAVSNSSVNFNEFVFNVGVIGLMVVHENSQISVRVQCSAGYSSTYRPSSSGLTKGSLAQPLETNYTTYGDIFFSGKAWITESTTGITLQAEITNNFIRTRPFYGVTLSKAINFKNISKIFQPIVPKP